MIYLQHIYQQSGLPQPASIALDISDSPLMQREVMDEFAYAFPKAHIQSGFNLNSTVDFAVLIYRYSERSALKKIRWGYVASKSVNCGIGFFCIDRRNLAIFPSARFSTQAIKELFVSFTVYLMTFPLKVIYYVSEIRKKVF